MYYIHLMKLQKKYYQGQRKNKKNIDYEIYVTKRARDDLYQIEYYIKYELKNAIVAKKNY